MGGLPTGLTTRDNLKNLLNEGKQMTLTKLLTGAPSAELKSWNAINWDKVERHVRRLQVRIAKAIGVAGFSPESLCEA